VNWLETDPRDLGLEPAGVERVVDLVEARGATAQLCVLRHGRVVLDRSFGCFPDSLFLIYSASKPFPALLVHLLAERGRLSLDDPVATHWPEFGGRGKDGVTIRHVLQHRAGIPVAGSMLSTLLRLTDWEASVRLVERSRPRWPPGAVPAYHFLDYGVILGELVRRVAGQPVAGFLRAELLDPFGLADTFLGLPDTEWRRHVDARPAGGVPELVNGLIFNRRAVRQAVIPSAGISATARDLARFYQMVLREGELDGVRVLAAATVLEARRPSSDEVDRFIKRRVRWAQGFHLGGPVDGRDVAASMGMRSSREAFGHNGNMCCSAWADPTRDLAFVYLSNLLLSVDQGIRHHGQVADAMLDACA
jgi:CubicO group peptidase (beta-lactamase class C family)